MGKSPKQLSNCQLNKPDLVSGTQWCQRRHHSGRHCETRSWIGSSRSRTNWGNLCKFHQALAWTLDFGDIQLGIENSGGMQAGLTFHQHPKRRRLERSDFQFGQREGDRSDDLSHGSCKPLILNAQAKYLFEIVAWEAGHMRRQWATHVSRTHHWS